MDKNVNLTLKTTVFEKLISDLIAKGLAKTYKFFDSETIEGLRQNLLQMYNDNTMQTAGIGQAENYKQIASIRSDKIKWIGKASSNRFEKQFNRQILDFIEYLNRTCYTGLNDYEFHYAAYEPGSFYQTHIDQFSADKGRRFTFVSYLNPDWKDKDGGEIVLYENETRRFLPEEGLSVFFKSDVTRHEVKPAKKLRLSIAGWLKTV